MGQKGRPKKVRYIQMMPPVRQFSPRGKPGQPKEVVLHMGEFEALKLADFQGFSQAEGALAMRLSRPSFGRALREARRKLADAVVNGKTIRIEVGDFQIGVRQKNVTRESLAKHSHALIKAEVVNLAERLSTLGEVRK